MNATLYTNLLIKLTDPKDSAFSDELSTALADVLSSSFTVVSQGSSTTSDSLAKVIRLLNEIFDIIIAITMFLCLFALSANMSANIYQQTKEIGVMRAIGFSKCRIRMLYFYEALVLVFSSCIMGVAIGMTVGYTMTLQQKLILQTPLPFFFPTEQFLVIVCISIFCAFISTFGPTT
jgi:ABC-type antimicrobial peptide transport system permease subunit